MCVSVYVCFVYASVCYAVSRTDRNISHSHFKHLIFFSFYCVAHIFFLSPDSFGGEKLRGEIKMFRSYIYSLMLVYFEIEFCIDAFVGWQRISHTTN